MAIEDINISSIKVQTKRFENGTQLQCNWGEGRENRLVGPWFGHEDDAKQWANFLKHVVNKAQEDNSDQFNNERNQLTGQIRRLSLDVQALDNKIAKLTEEKEALQLENESLKGNLLSVRDTINAMMDSALEQKVAEIQDSTIQTTLESADSIFLSRTQPIEVDLARMYKIYGLKGAEISKHLKRDLYGLLRDNNAPSFKDLCTKNDADFIARFKQPLFDDHSIMSVSRTMTQQNMITFLLTKKFKMIKNDIKNYTIDEIASELKIHPAYIWAVCLDKNLLSDQDKARKQKKNKIIRESTCDDYYKTIDALGGVKFLKQECDAGKIQRDVANNLGMYPSIICMYLQDHGESWSEWKKNQE